MDETLDQFVARYGGDRAYPVFEPGPDAAGWPTVLVRAGDKAAVVQFMNVAVDDLDAQHLCIDVHPFVAGRRARGSVFGMERGRRVSAFRGEQCEATSHGLPATHLVSVLVGRQRDTPQALVRWSRSARDRSPGQGRHGGWHTDGWSLVEDDGRGGWSANRWPRSGRCSCRPSSTPPSTGPAPWSPRSGNGDATRRPDEHAAHGRAGPERGRGAGGRHGETHLWRTWRCWRA